MINCLCGVVGFLVGFSFGWEGTAGFTVGVVLCLFVDHYFDERAS